jgi:S1-C subfamily serine protease
MHEDDTEQSGPPTAPVTSETPETPETSQTPDTAPPPPSAFPPPPPPPAPPLAPLAPTPATPMSAPTWPLPPADPAGSPPFAPPATVTSPVPPLDLPQPGGSGPGDQPPYVPPPFAAPAPIAAPRKERPWLAVAGVSALIGAIVGATVGVLVDNNGNSNGGGNTVIHESNTAPGAAALNGGVSVVALAKKLEPSVVSIDVKSLGSEDQGTGMIISPDGKVITNNHVIELFTQGGNSGSITVTEYGQTKSEPATLIGFDTSKDVALLKINNASNLPAVTFGNSTKAQVGDFVVAIGNALGLAAGTPTVTNGIISALGRTVTAGGQGTTAESLQNLIQTDAAINPGNSGGPLIDSGGRVIGMNTAVAGTSSDGTSAQNIGFAIPISQVELLIPELLKGGTPANGGGYLGVDITTLTAALRQQYGLKPAAGVLILTVLPGSPAAKAGLAQGDVIVSIDNKAIATAENLQSVVQNDKPGQSISVTYYSGATKKTTSVTLGTQAQALQEQQQQNGG